MGVLVNARMTAVEAASFLGVTVQAVHKQLRSKDLPFEKSQNRVFFTHETSRRLFPIDFRQKIIAIQIVKGGTGKTSLAQSIAIRANLYGARVLCIDLDQQGNLTQAFNINPEELPAMVDLITDDLPISEGIISVAPGLDLIPSRIENAVLDNTIMLKRLPLDRVYRDRLEPLREKYDLILIDCPPAIGQSVAAVTLAADLIMAPVTPEKFCLSGLKISSKEIANLEQTYKKKIQMKVVLNKFDTRTMLSHEVLSSLIKHSDFASKLYKSYIRVSQEFPNSIAKGGSIFDSLRENSAKEDVDLLTREVLELNDLKLPLVSLGSLEVTKPEATIEAAI
jgi:chromosome partitioning protein